jgi:hypothetical protein
MYAVRLSVRSWVCLLFALYILCEANALERGMRLVIGAPSAPVPATGQTVAMLIGGKGAPVTIYVTGHDQFTYYLWLAAGMIALVLGLGLMVWQGVRLALAERRARARRVRVEDRRG